MLDYVKPGQAFNVPATDYNAFVDAARAHLRFRDDGRTTRLRRSETVVSVTRETSGAFEPFRIVELPSLKLTSEDDLGRFLASPVFRAVTPSAVSNVWQVRPPRIAITLDAVPQNGCAPAIVEGLAPVRLLWPIVGGYANPIAGDTLKMKTSNVGAHRVLWNSTKKSDDPATNAVNGDTVWGLVKLNQKPRSVFMVATANWRKTELTDMVALYESLDFFYSGFTPVRRSARGWVRARLDKGSDTRDFWVILPCDVFRDPNVVEGQRFEAELLAGIDPASEHCLAATRGHEDERIGTVKIIIGSTSAIPAGWKLMDGTQNASPGSAIDTIGRAIYGATSASGAAAGEELIVTPSDIAARLNITPNGHNHSATPTKTTTTIQQGTGASVDVVTNVGGANTTSTSLDVIQDDGPGDLNLGKPVPDRTRLVLIERVDNSSA